VAVGDVVDKLADGPAAFAVRSVELGIAEAIGGGAEVFRERGDDGDVRSVVGEIRFRSAEMTDGVAGVDGGRDSGCAHTPQGTPLIRAGQGVGHTRSECRQTVSAGATRG
jgi:hypothetical protein